MHLTRNPVGGDFVGGLPIPAISQLQAGIFGTRAVSGYTLTWRPITEPLQATSPSSPSPGYSVIYPKNDDKWYFKTSGGTENEIVIVGGSPTFTNLTAASMRSGPAISYPGGVNSLLTNTVSGAAESSGTTQTNGVLRLASTVTSGVIDFGLNSATPWIQATDRTDLSQIYTLALNPNGGTVTVGGALSATTTITTGSSGSGSGAWKLGVAVAGVGLALKTTQYVEIDIGGTVYKLALVV